MLFLSSLDDWVIFPRHVKEMMAACKSSYKEILEFPDKGHSSNKGTPEYWINIQEFVGNAIERKINFNEINLGQLVLRTDRMQQWIENTAHWGISVANSPRIFSRNRARDYI